MALIASIIKKYEAEARQRIMEARCNNEGTKPIKNREDLFLHTKRPSGTPGAADDIDKGNLKGSIWRAKTSEAFQYEATQFVKPPQQNDPAPLISTDQASAQNIGSELGKEVESLKKENAELRARLDQIQQQLQMQPQRAY